MQQTTGVRKIALVSSWAALTIALQISPRPPNVEFTSFLTFVFGLAFGSVMGILLGSCVMFVNGFFSPWGFGGINIPFQMIGMSSIGAVGGFYGKRIQGVGSAKLCVEAMLVGSVLTLLYDILTNIGMALYYVLAGMELNLAVLTAFASGTPLSIIHVGTNMAVFGVMFFPFMKALTHIQM
jgi:hypothetical protein